MPDRELLVRIVGDDRDLQRALGRTDKRLEQIDGRTASFGRNIGRAFAAAGIALGTREVLGAANDAVQAASNLNEQISKSREVFGAASDDIETWSETTASSMGIAQAAALEATGTFGNLFAVVDIAPDQAARMSQALVQLAADLASFNNASPEDVLTAIRSGLIGEAEPLRRYGVLLSEARVQQQALAETGKLTVASLTQQEKALARYSIILEDTTKAQGDFSRTQDGLANQTRILRANFADLEADVGGALVPTFTRLATSANQLFDVLGRGQDEAEIQIDTANAEQQLRDVRAELDRWGPVINSRTVELREMLRLLEQFQAVRNIAPNEGAGTRGPGAVALSNAEVERKRLKAAQVALAKARQEFDEFLKGQGLKLDAAELTDTLSDDLAVLRAIEAAIQRRIDAEGRTFTLAQKLVSVRRQIASTTEAAAAEAERAGQDAFEATLDALDLNLDIAQASKSLADDKRALQAIEDAILAQIQAEGETTDLLRRLFDVRQEQAEVARRLAEQRRENRQARQFEALGLTAEGQERAPSTSSLERRRDTLEDRIKGTALDTAKNRALLENAGKVLSGAFGKVGRDVRLAIKRMFDEIAAGLKDGDGMANGQITPGGIRPLQRLVAGANLSAEQLAILQRNMSRRRQGRPVNAFGFDLDDGGFSTATSSKATGPNITVAPQDVNIYLDGEKVANVVIKHMQKTGRRRTNRRGGAGAGRGAIL